MPTYEKAPESVREMAQTILTEFETHQSLLDNRVKFDFIFARADTDPDSGEQLNDAITKGGIRCLGYTRKLSAKDSAMGRGDAEIILDADWWEDADEAQQRSLLDHELHHIGARSERDKQGRPKLFVRKHDVDVGWFSVIAARHGVHSQERIQAAAIMESRGQYFWPEIANTMNSMAGGVVSDRRTARLEVVERKTAKG